VLRFLKALSLCIRNTNELNILSDENKIPYPLKMFPILCLL